MRSIDKLVAPNRREKRTTDRPAPMTLRQQAKAAEAALCAAAVEFGEHGGYGSFCPFLARLQSAARVYARALKASGQAP
jgi:hypothetical protein